MIAMMLFLCGWGETGHQKRNSSAPQFFPTTLNNFKGWSEVLAAADLGHYVGDGHMPLHLTLNYDGKLTNQGGIHALYESRMIALYDVQ